MHGGFRLAQNDGENGMNLPKIDTNSLPDLGELTGLFGSLSGPGHDDTVVAIMVYVYESAPPEPIISLLT